MKIVIVGCGKIGKTVLSRLVAEKHDVIAVDNDMSVIQSIANAYDVQGICGNATEFDLLKEASVDKADLFIATTDSDELNMLSCFLAKRIGAKHTIARIREKANNLKSFNFIKEQLGLDLAINPEQLASKMIYNVLRFPSATNVETFGSHDLEMIEVLVKDDIPVEGITLSALKKSHKAKFLICSVCRDGEVYIPRGDFVLKRGDKIAVICFDFDTRSILELLGYGGKKVKNVMIMGASRIAYYLTTILAKNRFDVKVIDINESTCEQFCELVPSSVSVICGDGMSQDLLLEEGISSTDAFVALTGNDEANILVSVHAKGQNVNKVISKVNGDELITLANGLKLETVITPRKITADTIVSYARALQNSMGSNIETLYTFMNDDAEAIEFKVSPDFKYTNVELRNMKLKQDVLLAGIIRDKTAIIPDGSDVIMPNDRVIVISTGRKLYDLIDIIT